MEPITRLNYPLDLSRLAPAVEHARSIAQGYSDHRYPVPAMNWKIARYTTDYIEQIGSDFGIKCDPRFYFASANSIIGTHIDNGTLCSINFILSDDPSPVTFGTNDYVYKQALLNTSIPHGVKNGPVGRVLLKFSIFDESYESLASRIPYRL